MAQATHTHDVLIASGLDEHGLTAVRADSPRIGEPSRHDRLAAAAHSASDRGRSFLPRVGGRRRLAQRTMPARYLYVMGGMAACAILAAAIVSAASAPTLNRQPAGSASVSAAVADQAALSTAPPTASPAATVTAAPMNPPAAAPCAVDAVIFAKPVTFARPSSRQLALRAPDAPRAAALAPYADLAACDVLALDELPAVAARPRVADEAGNAAPIELCQALGPAAPYPICAIDCAAGCNGACPCLGRCRWEQARIIAWQAYAQGEYVGHERLAHVPEYRIRVDDQLEMIYRLTREETATPYRLNVGDEVRVESFADPELNRDLLIQPDGTITLRLLHQVHATGLTVQQLRENLDQNYRKFYKVPAITVTPLKVNTKLEDLRATVDRRAGVGGQSQTVRVTPEGTIALPAVGSVWAQGLTLPELQAELRERYRQEVEGIEVIPVLAARAPRYVFVLGEVGVPGRFELSGPTTILQALSMAGSWNVGANLQQIVVFRRGDDWRLLATVVNLEGALRGKQPCPAGEIWLDDSDVVIVPKSKILEADDFIELVFTRGIYGVFPMVNAINFNKLSTI